jgi:hypothetical protein
MQNSVLDHQEKIMIIGWFTKVFNLMTLGCWPSSFFEV